MGTIVGGKIESGRIFKGQQLLVMPTRARIEVLTIFDEDVEKDTAQCGENVRLRLKGIEEEEVFSGYVVCDLKNPVKVAKTFLAQLMILEHRNIITSGYPAVMHMHNVVEEVQITELIAQLDKKTGKEIKRKPIFARQGDALTVVIETRNPICMERCEDLPQLGRFTLRHETQTIAIGKIVDIIEDTQRK
jgi:peptide chain release factor subunit 3